MIYIKQIIFGVRCEAVDVAIPGWHTIHPENRPLQDEWMKEFNVTMLHGRKIVYMD